LVGVGTTCHAVDGKWTAHSQYWPGNLVEGLTETWIHPDAPTLEPRMGTTNNEECYHVRVIADLTKDRPRLTMSINGIQFPPSCDEGNCTVSSQLVPAHVQGGRWFPAASLTIFDAELLTDMELEC